MNHINTLVVHGDCPDGCAAAVIFKKIFENGVAYHIEHKKCDEEILSAFEKVPNNGFFTMVDIGPSEELFDKLLIQSKQKNITLALYDHHISRDWLLQKQISPLSCKIVFDITRCGSKIYLDEMVGAHPEIATYSPFLTIINDRDLWLNKLPESKQMTLLHQILGDAEFTDRFVQNPSPQFSHDELLLLNYEEKQTQKEIDKHLKTAVFKTDSENNKYCVIIGDTDPSELLHQAIVNNDLAYALLLNLNRGKGSIRSNGIFDAAKWAEKHGGGGHKGASGFRFEVTVPQF